MLSLATGAFAWNSASVDDPDHRWIVSVSEMGFMRSGFPPGLGPRGGFSYQEQFLSPLWVGIEIGGGGVSNNFNSEQMGVRVDWQHHQLFELGTLVGFNHYSIRDPNLFGNNGDNRLNAETFYFSLRESYLMTHHLRLALELGLSAGNGLALFEMLGVGYSWGH